MFPSRGFLRLLVSTASQRPSTTATTATTSSSFSSSSRNFIINNNYNNYNNYNNHHHYNHFLTRYQTSAFSTQSFLSHVPLGPPDPILGITVAFRKDTDPRKINLGVGAYRDDNGKPYILDSVRKVEEQIFAANLDHEYLPIGGDAAFTQAAANLLFGRDPPLGDRKMVSVQTLSGTGALRVAAAFLARFLGSSTVYMPDPTWANHGPIFQDSGLKTKSYAYYDSSTLGLNFKGLLNDLGNAPPKSIILLHACAHNPTGVDPSPEQWAQISQLLKEKEHFVLFDSAYQGFASGDPDKDALPIRMFLKDGHNVAVCQSFAKNFGLYGERVGALHIIAANATEAEAITSQLLILIRPLYSNPPSHGSRIVTGILTNPNLSAQWKVEVKGMADRIISMRQKLKDSLKRYGSTRDWNHVTNQIGMFCYSGLTPNQVQILCDKHHIYLTKNGRISVVGITSHNVDYLAQCIHEVTK